MTRAESQANLAYPEDIIDASPLAAYPNWIDRNLPFREGFVNGYKQAEKDLGWISIFDRLPAPSEWVVVCIEYCGHAQCLALATYNYETKEWHTADFEDGEQETVYVEYWMQIPNIIKEAKK